MRPCELHLHPPATMIREDPFGRVDTGQFDPRQSDPRMV
jgi:hypothetical protein